MVYREVGYWWHCGQNLVPVTRLLSLNGQSWEETLSFKHSQMKPLLSISTVMVYSFYFCPCLGQKAHCWAPSSGFPSLQLLIHQSILHTAAGTSSIQFRPASHSFLFKILQLLPTAFRTKPKLLSLTSKAFHVP